MEEKKRLNEEEVDLRDYLKVMGKRKWIIIITLLSCFLFSLLFTFLQRPVYRIKSAFEIGSIPIGSLAMAGSMMIMRPEATAKLCKSDYLLSKVKENLALPKKEEIKIKVESKPGSPVVTISLESSFPEKAVRIVNSITDMITRKQNTIYQKKIRESEKEVKEIQKKIISIQQKKGESLASLVNMNYLQQLQSRLNEIQERITSFKKSKVIFPATIPERPIKPRPVFNLALSIILGLFLGVFLAFFREYFSKT